jgi:hypothetical protein
LPWSSFSVEASEPLRSSELALRIHDGTFADISSGLLDARHAYVSPDMTSPDRHWWNLGSIVRVDYRGGAVDDAGNALTAGTWTAPIVPSIPTRDIGGTGGLVHWGALDFARGTHTHLAGEGLGFFGMVDPGNTVTTVSARISLCGPPDTRVRCTSVWSYPDQVPRSSSTVMYPDGLQTAEGCSAPQQVITLGQVTGETIVGPIGVAATFDHEDGSPLDDVAVVVHSIWADNNWAGGGS